MARTERCDMSDQRERDDSADPIEANDPIEPLDAIESSDRSERIDQRDLGMTGVLAHARSGCAGDRAR
jgi:hypothetical protein